MKEQKVLEILNDWNFWQKPCPTSIRREEYLGKMASYSNTGQLVVLGGARRSGKSTSMIQYLDQLIQSGTNSHDTLYLTEAHPD